jgi:hypothetical protein
MRSSVRLRIILQIICSLLLSSVLLEYGCNDLGSNPFGMSANPPSLILSGGDTTQVTLSGGFLPYSISSTPDPLVASASLVGSKLIVVGVGAGSTAIEVSDAASPRSKVSVPVSVQAGVSFSHQVQPIFDSHAYGCVSCHGGSGGLFLTAGQSYANLVNVQAQSGLCTDRKRVQPGNASVSALFLRLSGFTCGDRMPQGANAISQSDLNLIRDWINQGARNN